ncbi:hypothetical protein [Nonomuraea sp. NPDC049784]|uniref:hypothetical protein n=1 Tax=Nonomuraea sp. NPDC049784 TaxID=3154361 RepID=UPI0033CFB913
MAWTGPIEHIPMQEARRRYDAGLHISANQEHHATGYCFTRTDLSERTFDEIADLSPDWWAPIAEPDLPPHLRRPTGIVLTHEQLEKWAGPLSSGDVEALDAAIGASSVPDAIATIVAGMRRGDRDELAAPEAGVQTAAYPCPSTGPQPASSRTLLAQDQFSGRAATLSAAIESLTHAWNLEHPAGAALNVSAGHALSADIKTIAPNLADLALDVAQAIASDDPLRTVQLLRFAAELASAIDAYTEREEHESGLALHIIDLLSPGIALVARVLQVHTDPAAAERVTVGELIQRLQQFPQHLQVWVTAPASADGYQPLTGHITQAEDPDPAAGDPTTFVALAAHH